ncbi:MAG: hypothetical protein IKO07_11535 [Clostridia bacterium]|nr:hypothetical protein [Clostridia bacterium]
MTEEMKGMKRTLREEEVLEARRRTALERMKRVRYHYEKLLTEYEAATSSRGLVASWGRVGGSGNRIVKPTQDRALSAIAAEEHRRAMLDWFECIRGTYFRLKAREGKSPNLWRHQLMLARALQLYVFERAEADLMALAMGAPKKLSRRRVIAILHEAAGEVAADAERAGLFREDEECSEMMN